RWRRTWLSGAPGIDLAPPIASPPLITAATRAAHGFIHQTARPVKVRPRRTPRIGPGTPLALPPPPGRGMVRVRSPDLWGLPRLSPLASSPTTVKPAVHLPDPSPAFLPAQPGPPGACLAPSPTATPVADTLSVIAHSRACVAAGRERR